MESAAQPPCDMACPVPVLALVPPPDIGLQTLPAQGFQVFFHSADTLVEFTVGVFEDGERGLVFADLALGPAKLGGDALCVRPSA